MTTGWPALGWSSQSHHEPSQVPRPCLGALPAAIPPWTHVPKRPCSQSRPALHLGQDTALPAPPLASVPSPPHQQQMRTPRPGWGWGAMSPGPHVPITGAVSLEHLLLPDPTEVWPRNPCWGDLSSERRQLRAAKALIWSLWRADQGPRENSLLSPPPPLLPLRELPGSTVLFVRPQTPPVLD